MVSFPALFLSLAGATLLAALIAIWNSLRATIGGGGGVVLETVRDLPDQAALVDEKNSLLRAIKDLEYERAVGKIGDADFQRLDVAYRARAKQVLAQLDRDVKPLYERAEKLIEERLASDRADEPRDAKRKKKGAAKKSAPAKAALPGTAAFAELPDEVRAKTEEFVAKALAEHLVKEQVKEQVRAAEPESESDSDSEPESDSDSESEPGSDSASDSEPESDSEPGPGREGGAR